MILDKYKAIISDLLFSFLFTSYAFYFKVEHVLASKKAGISFFPSSFSSTTPPCVDPFDTPILGVLFLPSTPVLS